MKNKIIIVTLYILVSILYIIGPNSIFRVCKVMEKPMKCYWSTRSEIGIAIILIAVAVVYLTTKTAREKILLSFLAIVISIVAILIPSFLIGGCTMKTMPCQVKTFPSFYILSVVIIIISIINIVASLFKKEIRNEG